MIGSTSNIAACDWGPSNERNAGALNTLTVNGAEYRFRWIPAGTFMMGSPESEKDRSGDETLHQVTLTRGFWMQETPVTQRQWESTTGFNPSAFCDRGEYSAYVDGLDTSNFPVERVSWDNAVNEFIPKLNRLNSGLIFRLPTEAEWEYACGAGQAYRYSGSNVINDVAWYNDNSAINQKGRAHEVGTKQANGWGLYDMSGNVWEWCSDWYGKNYYEDGTTTDPQGPNDGYERVIRGGCWICGAKDCRRACRRSYLPGTGFDCFGFRLVLQAASE